MNGVKFQSTQPSQAVTFARLEHILAYLDISIHTALAGCDTIIIMWLLLLHIFQSTQPSQAVT